MDAVQFTTTVQVKKQDIQDLLVCAFEGGSNYWYGELEPLKETVKGGTPSDRFYGDMMKHGFRLVDRETGKTHEIFPINFQNALKTMHDKFPSHFTNLKNENTDASTGDVFLQLLCFGDVIYG